MKFEKRSFTRTRCVSRFGIVVFAAFFLSGSAAHARTEILRWTHSRAAEVQRWEARVGSSSQSPGSPVVALTNPSVDAQGIYQTEITVPDAASVYIALRAIGTSNVVSPFSNEILRSPAGTGGGGGSGQTTLGAGQTIPPASNAILRRDFSSSAAGSVVTGWVDTGADFSLGVNDELFGVVDVNGNLTLATNVTANDVHSHLQSPPTSLSNSMLSGRLALTAAQASIGVTSYSRFPAQARYYRLGSNQGGAFTIAGVPSFSCASASTGVVPEINTWYVFRLMVTSEASRNRIQAKVWRQGDPEPANPQAECLDSSSTRSLDGTIGVWASGIGQKYWDDLEVTPLSLPAGATLAPPLLIQIVPVTP